MLNREQGSQRGVTSCRPQKGWASSSVTAGVVWSLVLGAPVGIGHCRGANLLASNEKNGAGNAYYTDDPHELAEIASNHIQIVYQIMGKTAKSGDLVDDWMLLIINSIYFGGLVKQPMDISSIIEATGISRAAVYRRLRDLEGRGYIEIVREKNRRIPHLTDTCAFDPTSLFSEVLKLIIHSARRAKKTTPCPICYRFDVDALKGRRGCTDSSTIGEKAVHD